MKREYYEFEPSGQIMKLLWKAAGGDRYLLERATYSDQVKYACLGGIITATGGMAMLAGGYAFYTIFCPKTIDGELTDSLPHYFLSSLFGVIWGLIIFNIDRFIVTSTGKGDGTEEITWKEFKGAIPRIIMGIIIAITISKPIEIRMFQTEIQSELIKKKADQENTYKIGVENRHKSKLLQLETDISKLNEEMLQKKIALDKSNIIAIEKCGSNNPNCLNHIQIWNNVKNEESAFNSTKTRNESKISNYTNERDTVLALQGRELQKAQSDGKKLDGLLERISILHEIASRNVSENGTITHSFPWIEFFVTMLFMTIELTPIFFKLMLTKTPYDYLTENRDDLIKAENGIEVRYDYYKEKDGLERHLVKNHSAEKLIYEKRLLATAEKIINRYAIQKYIDQEKYKIDNEPHLGGYIQSKDNND
jgi:hypothetical protein